MAQLAPTINTTTGLAILPARPDSPYYKIYWMTVNGVKKIVGKPRYDTTDVNAFYNVLAGDTWADIESAANEAGVSLSANPNIGP